MDSNRYNVVPAFTQLNDENNTIPEAIHHAAMDLMTTDAYNQIFMVIDTVSNTVCGYIIIGHAQILDLFVEESHRRQGIGDYLVSIATDIFHVNSVATYTDNLAAVNLYKKHGFVVEPAMAVMRRSMTDTNN